MNAREIWRCSNCGNTFLSDANCTCDRPHWDAPLTQAELTAAGYRLLAPGELDEATKERCAQVAETLIPNGKHKSQNVAHVSGHRIALAIRSLDTKGTEE